MVEGTLLLPCLPGRVDQESSLWIPQCAADNPTVEPWLRYVYHPQLHLLTEPAFRHRDHLHPLAVVGSDRQATIMRHPCEDRAQLGVLLPVVILDASPSLDRSRVVM